MFDVGFSELIMVGLVTLLVLGPEKLPAAARIAGFWLGKTRSVIASVKSEIKQELHAEELRQILQKQLSTDDIQDAAAEGDKALTEIHQAFEELSEHKTGVNHDKPD